MTFVGSYFEFLIRRVAVAVIPSPMAAIPASAIALGVVSPVFASLPAVVFACLAFEFACLEEIEQTSNKSASDIEITVEELLDFGIDVDQVIQRRC